MTSNNKHHALEFVDSNTAIELENNLWWIQGRKNIISFYLNQLLNKITTNRIIDIGCGSGGNLETLAEFGSVIGIEPSPTLAERSRERHIAINIYEKPIWEIEEKISADLYTMFDVLEHIEDDVDFLSRLKASSANGHSILLSVPACPFLYGEHDRLLNHYRRYSKKSLIEVLELAGYEVQSIRYYMFFMFPIVLVIRLLDKFKFALGFKRNRVNIGNVHPLLNWVLKYTLILESAFAIFLRFPFGVWLFAVAKSK